MDAGVQHDERVHLRAQIDKRAGSRVAGVVDQAPIGIGGHFAGPLTADYFVSDGGGEPSFGTMLTGTDPGTWNGAESLAGNDGTMPGPEGGPITDYLALDGGYGFLGKYGGAGTWNATLE